MIESQVRIDSIGNLKNANQERDKGFGKAKLDTTKA